MNRGHTGYGIDDGNDSYSDDGKLTNVKNVMSSTSSYLYSDT